MTLVGFRGKNHPQQIGERGALDRVDDRGTPPELFDPLMERFQFTKLDGEWVQMEQVGWRCRKSPHLTSPRPFDDPCGEDEPVFAPKGDDR